MYVWLDMPHVQRSLAPARRLLRPQRGGCLYPPESTRARGTHAGNEGVTVQAGSRDELNFAHGDQRGPVSDGSGGAGGNRFIFALLAGASAACVALVVARVIYSHTDNYGFLIWNLILAWIPFGLAALAYRMSRVRRVAARLGLVITLALWLLFFPNAPYIVTDLLHLTDIHDRVPVWYDAMLVAWFAWTGMMLGVVSLRLVQEMAARAGGSAAGWLAVVLTTMLGSVGIYFGRFLRWNSWQVFQAPLAIVHRTWGGVREPSLHVRFIGFWLLFTALFLFVYATVFFLSKTRGFKP